MEKLIRGIMLIIGISDPGTWNELFAMDVIMNIVSKVFSK